MYCKVMSCMYAKFLWEVPGVGGAWAGLGLFVCQSSIIQTSVLNEKTFESLSIYLVSMITCFGWKTSLWPKFFHRCLRKILSLKKSLTHVRRTSMMFFEFVRVWKYYFSTQDNTLVQWICVSKSNTFKTRLWIRDTCHVYSVTM